MQKCIFPTGWEHKNSTLLYEPLQFPATETAFLLLCRLGSKLIKAEATWHKLMWYTSQLFFFAESQIWISRTNWSSQQALKALLIATFYHTSTQSQDNFYEWTDFYLFAFVGISYIHKYFASPPKVCLLKWTGIAIYSFNAQKVHISWTIVSWHYSLVPNFTSA